MVPIRCGECRNGIGSVLSGRMVFMQDVPGKPPLMLRLLLVAAGPGKFKVCASSNRDQAACPKRNRRAARTGKAAAIEIEEDLDNQLLRRPSAARFHCVTLSAIMRVDFIAAWLSWA